MTHPDVPPHGRDDVDDRIGAWLDGDLTGADAQAFTAELDADPELAERVEAIRAVRERLIGADVAEAPSDFAARVSQAVAGEGGDAHPGSGPSEEPTSIEALRERRARRRRVTAAIGSVAALLVAVAVVTPLVTVQQDAADLDTADAPADDAAGSAEGDSGSVESESQHDEEAFDADDQDARGLEELRAGTSAGSVPLVVDEQTTFDSPSALLAHFDGRPEAVELLGAPPREAAALAEETAAELADADTFTDGTRPDACVDRLAADADGPVVFSRVERLILDGEPLTAHLVVTGPAGEPLERIVVAVLDPDMRCADRLTERLE